MADSRDFYIVYLPTIQAKPRGTREHAKHLIRPIGSSMGGIYGNGCLKHNWLDCFTCPFPKCDYDSTKETELRRQIKEGERK